MYRYNSLFLTGISIFCYSHGTIALPISSEFLAGRGPTPSKSNSPFDLPLIIAIVCFILFFFVFFVIYIFAPKWLARRRHAHARSTRTTTEKQLPLPPTPPTLALPRPVSILSEQTNVSVSVLPLLPSDLESLCPKQGAKSDMRRLSEKMPNERDVTEAKAEEDEDEYTEEEAYVEAEEEDLGQDEFDSEDDEEFEIVKLPEIPPVLTLQNIKTLSSFRLVIDLWQSDTAIKV